jgi:hypothetical protein
LPSLSTSGLAAFSRGQPAVRQASTLTLIAMAAAIAAGRSDSSAPARRCCGQPARASSSSGCQ